MPGINRNIGLSKVRQASHSSENIAFTSPDTFSALENQVDVGMVSANSGSTYSIVGGPDSAKFAINSITGKLVFDAAQFVAYNTGPNYTSPTDSNADNVYQVIVRATKAGKTLDQTINITVTAIANNLKTALIGSQLWKKRNYEEVVTAMGFAIPNVTVNATWATATTTYNSTYAATSGTVEQKTYAAVKAAAMWRYYSNLESNGTIYGKLYNWYAAKLIQMDIEYFNAANPNAIYGYRVPERIDYDTSIYELGGSTVAGGKLKEVGAVAFASPNTGADNSSGFSALGSGLIWTDGVSWFKTTNTNFWTLTLNTGSNYRTLELTKDTAATNTNTGVDAIKGNPIRLIKDLRYNIPAWVGKNWSYMGDSISAIYPPRVLQELLVQSTNCSVGGTAVAGTGTTAMNNDARINVIDANSNLITILGGTNDWAQSVPLGTIDSLDTLTFYGAYNVMLNKIIARCPSALILLMTTTYGYISSFGGTQRNSNGFAVTDYSQAVRNIAANRGLQMLDLESLLGWNISNYTTVLSDGLHPNTVGAIAIKDLIIAKLKTVSPI